MEKVQLTFDPLDFNDSYFNYLDDPTRLIAFYGGAGCFGPNQVVITDKGPKKISEVSIGELIKCFDIGTKEIEYRPCVKTWEHRNSKKTIRVKLKNGSTIEATEDHKFFFRGSWVELKDIVSLWHERNIQKDTRI